MIVRPQKLSLGETITVVAPSEPIGSPSVAKINRFFQKKGYQVKFPSNILNMVGDYVAGTVIQRATDFNTAFADSEVKAIFMAVGGFGASQILDTIDFEMIKRHPKIFVGYSDATTLQLAIFAKTGLVSFHGPNAGSLADFDPKGFTMSNFWRILTTDNPGGVIKPQSVWQEVVPGKAEGVLFGGNLSCLTRLLGTPWDPIAVLPKLFGKETKYIFFWEEVSDQFSEIMRNLWQVRNTGFFETVSGMVIGKLTDVAEKDYRHLPSKKVLIREVVSPFAFPVLSGVDFGHEVPQITIPIGVKATIDTSTTKLTILEPAVI